MSFFGEMASALGFDEARLALGYNYIVYNGEAVSIEGVKRILRIDENETAFSVAGGVLYVSGKSLNVADICGGSVTVRGEIFAVYTSKALEKQNGGEKQ